MKPALLIVDVQKDFFHHNPQMTQSLKEAIEYINAAIALFRSKSLPVVFIQHVNEKENLVPGVEGFDLPDELQSRPSDVHIHKTYGNAFNKTNLYSVLKEWDVDSVILTGFCAEQCVLSTYRGAEDLDLAAIILKGALASGSAENIRFVESTNEIISIGALEKVLN